MTETKSNPVTGPEAIDELLKQFGADEFENVDLKSIELAVEHVELQLKNIRRALKAFRQTAKKKNTKVLKG